MRISGLQVRPKCSVAELKTANLLLALRLNSPGNLQPVKDVANSLASFRSITRVLRLVAKDRKAHLLPQRQRQDLNLFSLLRALALPSPVIPTLHNIIKLVHLEAMEETMARVETTVEEGVALTADLPWV